MEGPRVGRTEGRRDREEVGGRERWGREREEEENKQDLSDDEAEGGLCGSD